LINAEKAFDILCSEDDFCCEINYNDFSVAIIDYDEHFEDENDVKEILEDAGITNFMIVKTF